MIVGYHGYLDSWIPWIELDIMDSLSIDIQVSGYFWILEKSTKFTKMWQIFVISQKNYNLSISIQLSMDSW